MLWTITEPCLNREFPQEQLKKIPFPQNLRISSGVLWYGGSCQEMCGAILWVSQQDDLNNSTKYILHASMTTTSKKKKWNLLENCHMYALKLFWNAHTWHELDDLIFYGQWINLHGRLRNWPKPVTNAWIDWFHFSSYMWIRTILSCR